MSGKSYSGNSYSGSSRSGKSHAGKSMSKGKAAAKNFRGTHAPYNFVPLPKRFIPPGWRKKTSIDVPLEQGLCGELELELETFSPLMVGAERKDSDTVPFFNIDGQPVIPGSSIRGMIRNLAEIVSFGKLPEVNNQYPTLRDVRDRQYKSMLTGGGDIDGVKPGWLFFSAEHNQYMLKPCQYARISYAEISKICDCGYLKNDQKITAKYRKAGGFARPVKFDLEKLPKGGAVAKQGHSREGRLVMTGWAYNKNKEYVFYNEQAPEAIPAESMLAFNHIYRQQGPKSMYAELDKLHQKNEHQAPGLPVFFTRNQAGQIRYLGLTLMMKIPPEYSVDALHPKHKDSPHVDVDIVQNLFGFIDDTAPETVEPQYQAYHYSLKSRLSFADLEAEEHEYEDDTAKLVLGQPSASFYPAYLVQSANSREGQLSYRMVNYHDQQKPELRGFKRYPIQKDAPLQPAMSNLEKTLDELKDDICVTLKPLAKGARFVGKIRYHNITPKELGLLLWCLTWGERQDVFHNMGMAKPYGYGQLQINIKKLMVERNNAPGEWKDETADIGRYCKLFSDMMEQVAKGSKYKGGWIEGPIMKELLTMAKGQPFAESQLQYLPLRHHVLAKANDSASNRENGFALKAFTAWLEDGKRLG